MKQSVQKYSELLAKEFAEKTMVVFLCGPSLRKVPLKPGAELRQRLQIELEKSGFEVVLGEDDGLEELQAQYDLYAHLNELKFISDSAAAIVIVADSPGSFCELGLFSYVLGDDSSPRQDITVLLDHTYKSDPSYLNRGPGLVVEERCGTVFHADFATFDVSEVVRRLARIRSVISTETRGRRRGT